MAVTNLNSDQASITVGNVTLVDPNKVNVNLNVVNGIPQYQDIATNRAFVIRITNFTEDHVAERVLRNMAGATEINAFDHARTYRPR